VDEHQPGINRVQSGTAEFRHYTAADGLPGQRLYRVGTGCQGRDGRLYFGGFDGGFSLIRKSGGRSLRSPGRAHRLPAAVCAAGSRTASLLSKGIYPSGRTTDGWPTMKTACTSNSRRSATSTRRRTATGTSWRVWIRQWNEVSPYQRSATYTTLPAGSYVFRAQGATARGAWSEPGIVFRLEVLQPWWMTWWFRLLAAIVVIGIAVGRRPNPGQPGKPASSRCGTSWPG
jgi:hypothetical protein